MVLGELVTHGVLRLFVPKDSEPRWYHVVAIIGSCMLLFSGFLGSLVNFVEGDVVFGVVSLAMFTIGFGCALLIRRSLERTVAAPRELAAAADAWLLPPRPAAPPPLRVVAWMDLAAAAATVLLLGFLATLSFGSVFVAALVSARPPALLVPAIVLLVAAWWRLRRADRSGAIQGALGGALLAIAAWWESLTAGLGPALVAGVLAGLALAGANAWAATRRMAEKA